jgi:hypothetical protein
MEKILTDIKARLGSGSAPQVREAAQEAYEVLKLVEQDLLQRKTEADSGRIAEAKEAVKKILLANGWSSSEADDKGQKLAASVAMRLSEHGNTKG